MENAVLFLPALLWQIFNAVVLLAVFVFLGWRTVKVILRRLAAKRRKRL